MITALFTLIERFFGDSLALWSGRIHGAALAVLLTAWFLPPLRWGWRRWRAQRKPWAPIWVCPSCGHGNAAVRVTCEECQDGSGPDLWRRWRKSRAGTTVLHVLDLAGLSIRVGAAVFFYVVTFLAAHRFHFFRFDQKPLQELLAGLAVVLLLMSLFYFRRALSWKWGSPVARVTDLLSAAALGGFFAGAWVLWAAAPFTPGEPLARVSVTPDGVFRLHAHRERRGQSTLNPETGGVILPVQYGRLSWPLLGIDQTFVVKVATQPAVSWIAGRCVQRLAPRWSADSAHRPRLVLLRQTLEAVPPGTYGLHLASFGDGLTLRAEAP